MEELKTVKLLGAAGRKFGREFRLVVQSPAEAVRALCCLFPEFKGWVLAQHEKGVVWRVITDDPDGLEESELTRSTGTETIILCPVLQGAGGVGAAIGKIVVGVALILVGTLVTFATMGAGTPFVLAGVGLLFSGVADLITPTPQLSGPKASGGPASYSSGTEASRSDDLESNLFARNQGTSGQGECVPLLYGQRRVSSPRLVSFDLRNLPNSRELTTTGTQGLLGYVNGTELT